MFTRSFNGLTNILLNCLICTYYLLLCGCLESLLFVFLCLIFVLLFCVFCFVVVSFLFLKVSCCGGITLFDNSFIPALIFVIAVQSRLKYKINICSLFVITCVANS